MTALKQFREDENSTLAMEMFCSFVENSPVNVMFADLEFRITYLNPKSLETLKTLEKYLPVAANQVQGSSIDIFHQTPSHQRRMLSNPKNLPHRAQIKVGPEILDLLVSAVYDQKGRHVGAQVTWSVITQNLALEKVNAEIRSMMENAPINVISCDRDFTIKYVNPASLRTLKTLQQYLPIPADEIVGKSIDIFHKNPAHQRQMLKSERNLPVQSIISLGPEKLQLLVTAILDQNKDYVGNMVTWEVVTEKLKQESELAIIRSMVENAPINVMFCGLDFKISYINPASTKTLKSIEHLLPVRVNEVVGSSIDIFHKKPDHQRRLLANDRNLPHRATIALGPEKLDLLASAIYDKGGQYIGSMVTWSVVTSRVTLVENLTQASQQLATAAEELNSTALQMNANSEQTRAQANTVASAAEEMARGVDAVATNTEEMNASIKEIARNANEASSMSEETKGQADKTNRTIAQLGLSSQEIGNVIKVISSIAQQTNLLALNATIEAARAGDAGRGFSVVANEVKELAKQTASATEEITQKIGAIQNDTGGAVKAIQEIGVRIEKLNGIAGSIAAAVDEQMATTSEVARIIQQSNQGVTEIASNIKQVSTAAGNTTVGATQVVDAAKGLAELAVRMKELVAMIEK